MPFPTLEQYLNEDIFTLMGIPNAPDEQKQEIMDRMMSTVQARVVMRISELLSEDEADEFKRIAETEDPDELAKFLVEKEIDLPQVVAEEAIRHRTEMVTMIKAALGED